MKKKHLNKLIDLLLENKAFINDSSNQPVITDEMKDVLKKLRSKEKPSKLQEAVTTLIKENKKTGKPLKIEIPPSTNAPFKSVEDLFDNTQMYIGNY